VSQHDGRYAPSPSGPLHLGNLRTALLAWLFARSQGARFLLRIEDLDPQRSRLDHELTQISELRQIGLDWDGEIVRQSERRERHREAFEGLRASGRAYPCWCTRAEARQAASAPHGEDEQGAYPGTCRALSPAERAARARRERPRAWRLDGGGERVRFSDLLHGRREGSVDDFVIWRGDDVPAYNLAVVIDDADAGIGEVVRGDDLLAGTPRQVLLAKLLGLPPVRHAHVPLILGPDGRRLAKRHGAVTLEDWQQAGASAAQLVGWLASSAGVAEHGLALWPRELVSAFDRRRLARAPTVLAARAKPPPRPQPEVMSPKKAQPA
jgi:glutamyl-tRNA synthetase